MSTGSALKKINKEAKRLQKKFPKRKYRSLQKEAGKAFREGKLKPKKRKIGSSGNTRTATKASTSRNRTATKTITAHIKVGAVKRKRAKAAKRKRIYRAEVTKVKAYRAKRYKRVSGVGGKSLLMPLLLIGGGLLAWKLFSPSVSSTALVPRTNPVATANANSTLQIAQAAGLGLAAITALIKALNSQPDATISSSAYSPQQAAQAAANAEATGGQVGDNSYFQELGFN